MARCFSYALRRLVSTWIVALVVIGGFLGILGLGPGVEPAVYPVLTNQTSKVLSSEGGVTTFDLRFYKVRPCRIQDVDWVLTEGERAATVGVYREDGTLVDGSSSYSVGWVTVGPFHFKSPSFMKNPDFLYGSVYYDCHPGWLTRQTLGPVVLR